MKALAPVFNENRRWFHCFESAAAEKTTGFRSQAQVKAYYGAPQDILLRRRSDSHCLQAGELAARAPRQHRHAECAAQSATRADAAQAKYSERFAVQLREHFARPCAVAHFVVDRGNLACHRQHQRDRVLGHRDRVHAGCVANSYAAARRRIEIDIIRPRTPDRYETQAGTGAEHHVAKMRVSADIDRDLCSADAARKLGLFVGAAVGVDA